MILAIVCTGKTHKEEPVKIIPQIQRFINNGWDVKILTDNPSAFPIGETFYYENKMFSYVDKLLFSFRLMSKTKQDILYVDHDWLSNLNDDFVKNFKADDEIVFYDYWGTEYLGDGKYSPVWRKFIENRLDYYNDLYDYWNVIGFDYTELIVLRENFLYLPYFEMVDDMLVEIEKIKPILEFETLKYSKGNCTKYGNGEGIALGVIIQKYDIKIKELDKKYLTNE